MSYLDFYLFGAAYIALSFGWQHRADGWPAWLFGAVAASVWPVFSVAAVLLWARKVLPFRK